MKSAALWNPRSASTPTRHRSIWQRHAQRIPRWAKLGLMAVLLSIAMLALRRGLRDIIDQGRKQEATDFSGLYDSPTDLWSPQQPVRRLNGSHIDERYVYSKHLGSGQEGSASVYVDNTNAQMVVIKTYTSNARNPLPKSVAANFASFTKSWPTEIEASLLVAATNASALYLPVVDYFILEYNKSWSWALVTPFVSGGTLGNLGLLEYIGRKPPEDLDWLYRSSLTALLITGLKPLHDAGVCHDDIKGDNIYIRSRQEWLLGDLGNVRHVSHPWHYAPSWVRQNQWKDCQLNDIRRALKSYMWFLRQSSQDSAEFDREFWIARSAWSRLYWSFVQHPRRIDDMLASLEGQRIELPQHRSEGEIDESVASPWKWNARLAVVTERELICTTIPKRLWKWWWWVSIF